MSELSVAFDVDAARRDFPILQKPLPKGIPLVYLDSASSAQKPQSVIDKEMEAYENYYANAYRGVYRFGARVDDELEGTRSQVQRLLNAEHREEIVFTPGSTMAINLVAYAWARKNLRPGDEVLINEMEHHANFVPWQQMALETGASCRFIPLTVDGRLDIDQLDKVLTPRTKLVAVSAMSNVLGTINPVKQVACRAREVGALTLVDGAQGVPHLVTDVRDLGVDFLVFSGHKLFGPSGIGVLYGRLELLEAMSPFLYGGHMIEQVTTEASTWATSPAKFEAGTIPIAQAIALGAAVDYVTSVGFEAIEMHERQLLNYAHRRMMEIPGMQIYGPPPTAKGAIISFTVDGAHPEDLAQLLDRRGVFVRHGHHCTMPLHQRLGVPATVRASFAFYNTLAEVDALCDGIQFAREKLRLN
jgi:cysteine desulfurase/selenocysteine lyase